MILQGDCLDKMSKMEDNSVDSVVTDPPFGISFMGKKWDYDVPKVEVWKEALRVLKPGGHILVACGTRTQHRMTVNIEDAGFEIRDIVAWVYGSGFPKSHNIGKNIEKIKVGGIKNLKKVGTKKGIKVETGTQGFSYSKEYVAGKSMGGRQISGDIPIYEINNEYEGWGTALKPAMELWTLARKPLSEKTVAENVLKHGTGGINIDGCRVGIREKEQYAGAKKPKSESNANCYGDYNYEKSKNPLPQGRFPANLLYDGSDEVVGLFPDSRSSGIFNRDLTAKNNWNPTGKGCSDKMYDDSGSASRFFYCAKASKSERNAGLEGFEKKQMYKCDNSGQSLEIFGTTDGGREPRKNNHPTVKPIKLMQYLTRLITPKGGTVLDPFMGSGTTGIACKKEGFEFIGIELDAEYFKIAEARINNCQFQKELF